jgi:GT2 family glycosyltransferase
MIKKDTTEIVANEDYSRKASTYPITQRITMVLGMDYAGASIIADALKALDIAVLDHNVPLLKPNNSSGWWKRDSVVALNDRVLNALSIKWHSVRLIEPTAWYCDAIAALKHEAVGAIKAWMDDFPYWAFQDSRTVRLLPFWQDVFSKLGVETNYIIVVRNPIHVAQCLLEDFNLVHEKSYLLWLHYTLPAITATQGLPRIFIDYDDLQADLSSEMHKVVHGLTIPVDTKTSLRSSPRFYLPTTKAPGSSTHNQHLNILQPTKEAYQWIKRIISGELADGDVRLQATWARIEDNLKLFSPVLYLLDQITQDAKSATLEQAFLSRELERHAENITYLKSEFDGNISHEREIIRQLEACVNDQKQHIDHLQGLLMSIEQSKAWRLTYPLRRGGTWLKRLVKGLRRRKSYLELVPTNNLQPADANPKTWETTGHDPYFLLKPTQTDYPTGWIRIFFNLQFPVKAFASCCLYIDGGAGFSEANKVELPIIELSTVDRIVLLPASVVGLRLDVDSADHTVQFTLSTPEFTEISKLEAQTRIVAPFLRAVLKRPDKWLYSFERVFFHWRTLGWRGIKNRVADLYGASHQSNAYSAWVAAFDTLSDQDRQAIKMHIQQLTMTPLISVIMPVYNTTEKYLRHAIESVRTQLYPHWELCIADDASSQPHVKKILNEYRTRDPRIKVVFRQTNGHISAASNSALKIAQGEFAALLDHDDELAEHALYMMAAEINAHPNVDIIYSDEDKIDKLGIRHNPYFKCDWNPDLFNSQNYVSHLGVYRTSVVQKVGGFRVGYEGSQDYDLCLRCVNATTANQIRHVPYVLYHWRVIEGSTALDVGEKPYAERSALKMHTEHFKAINPKIQVGIGNFPTSYRVRYPLPNNPPLVSLIIPTRDGYKILKQCIDSILEKTTYPNYEIIIVDNQSKEPQTLFYFEKLSEYKNIRIIRYNHPFNFSRINNYAARQAKGSVIGLINNDIEVISPEWLDEMVSHALRPEIGAVGAKLLYGDTRIQHGGIILGMTGLVGHSHKGSSSQNPAYSQDPGYFGKAGLIQNVSAVTAACLVIRKKLYLEVGGLEEDNLTIAFNDVDFCLRIADAGYLNLWTPYAQLYHYESISRGYENTPEKLARFQKEIDFMKKRWGERLESDPYYNPNLTLDNESFSLAYPPRVLSPWLHLRKHSTDESLEEVNHSLRQAS